ncbi:MAG: nucleoside-diphosphate sugar epimerase/dehydratase [Pseudomonadota bacterium]
MMPKARKKWREVLRIRLLNLRRPQKRLLMYSVDGVAIVFTFLIANLLVLAGQPLVLNSAAIGLASALVFFVSASVFGLYRSIIRYLAFDLLIAVTKSAVMAAAVGALLLSMSLPVFDAFRVAVVFGAGLVCVIVGVRLTARNFLNRRVRRRREAVIIYGAGDGGVRLASSLSGSSRFNPVAFVDNKRALKQTLVAGLEVHLPERLPALIRELNVRRVLLALPSISRRRRREIIEELSSLAVRVQTIPDIGDILTRGARVDDIQDVSVEDLLGRDPVPPKQMLLRQEIAAKVVLVTGAGGSIGSELSRKILEVEPRVLLLVERSEIALYNIEQSLRKAMKGSSHSAKIVAMLGDCQDKARMLEVMSAYNVDTVYHAAAYKHVPIVEHNVIEGVANNVFGTLNTALAAVESGVATFVLVSTDKAVSPTNVMGASKRLSELVLQNLDSKSRTRFCMVRFGNVLASSGSVVPLFREQIRAGGPVTVTHPEIIRYFMTIPEAAQLVIQAGAMAKGGDVFVLDMGKPVKIVDLASKMILLMGKTVKTSANPDGEIEISFTGLRPAEKLYEELLIGNDVTGTNHPRIMRANERSMDDQKLSLVLDEIHQAIEARNWEGLRAILLSAVEGYRPTGEIEDHIYTTLAAQGTDANVTDLDRYR